MRVMTFFLAAAFGVSCAPLQGKEIHANPSAPVFAAGSLTCDKWVIAQATPDSSDARAQRYWVAGVMSAYNIYVAPEGFNIGKGVTPGDLGAWMTTRCSDHPSETIGQAAQAFIRNLEERQKEKP